MDYTIIDAHAHLWLRQDTVVDGLPIRTLENGRSEFMGEIRQMVPPFMIDGVNSAEVFLSNMDYAQVAAAVITQEFIDGIQNDYLSEVVSHYPNRFFVCGMCEFRKPGFLENVMIESGGITWLFNDEFYPFKGAVKAIREAADLVGMEKLMWGSDYPRTITAITYKMSYDFVVKSSELTEEDKRLFLGENARNFYGFTDLPVLPYIKNMSE